MPQPTQVIAKVVGTTYALQHCGTFAVECSWQISGAGEAITGAGPPPRRRRAGDRRPRRRWAARWRRGGLVKVHQLPAGLPLYAGRGLLGLAWLGGDRCCGLRELETRWCAGRVRLRSSRRQAGMSSEAQARDRACKVAGCLCVACVKGGNTSRKGSIFSVHQNTALAGALVVVTLWRLQRFRRIPR